VLEHGLSGVSLRPLAAAVGSSPRVLLFLFGSKDGLVRALLGRARADELALLERIRGDTGSADLHGVVTALWGWLSDPRHRPLLRLWLDAYAQSVAQPDGPWGRFARETVEDWLALMAAAQPPAVRDSAAGVAERTLALAVLRGALLDLLATGERDRTTAAVSAELERAREG
jgi:AcrR family transcriptional regulator